MKAHLHIRSGILTTILMALLAQLPLGAAQRELATFTKADTLESWTSVNAGVMGGLSKGGLKRTDQGTLLFSGELSLENNGGFASVRTKPGEFNLSGMSSIVVKSRAGEPQDVTHRANHGKSGALDFGLISGLS